MLSNMRSSTLLSIRIVMVSNIACIRSTTVARQERDSVEHSVVQIDDTTEHQVLDCTEEQPAE